MARPRSAIASLWPKVALAAILLSLLHPVAAASSTFQPGVHGDPGSPAGKEYAFPVGTARGIDGGRGTFGAGITPGTAAPGGSGGHSGDSSGSRRSSPHAAADGSLGSSTGATGHRAAGTGAAGKQPAPRLGRAGVGSGAEWMLAAAVVVVGLGVLGGQLLVRFARRDKAPTE